MRRHDTRGSSRHTLSRQAVAVQAAAGLGLLAAVVLVTASTRPEPRVDQGRAAALVQPAGLAPTVHAPIPRSLAEAWLVPPATAATPPGALRDFARGVKGYEEGNYAQALLLVSDPRLETTPLSAYASYYTALCYLRLSRPAEARAVLTALRARNPEGFLIEAVPLAEAEAALTASDAAAAVRILDEASQRKSGAPDMLLDRVAAAAAAAGDMVRADGAILRLYYDYPTSPYAADREGDIERIRAAAGKERAAEFIAAEQRRAERLFALKRYAEALAGFQRIKSDVSGDDAELVNLRIAECNHFLGRNRNALEQLQPYLEGASRRAEAKYFELSALRAMGRDDEYPARVDQLVTQFPDSSWSADALNGLAGYRIRTNDDEAAATVFKRLLDEFPASRYSDRAAWKYGWWQYKTGEYASAASVFEAAAARSPRSDFRPAWLYWAGRARDKVDDRSGANARFQLVTVDYLHSYYGRLAASILRERGLEPGRVSSPGVAQASLQVTAGMPSHGGVQRATLGAHGGAGDVIAASTRAPAPAQPRDTAISPSTAEVVKSLIGVELYALALEELRFLQRNGANGPAVDATIAWIVARQGDLRRGINGMKQAYPQYLSADGDELPEPVLKVIFPLEYWDLIRRYSSARGLDPYLVAALVAQESTFDPDARSSANARGLMQIVPSTGRRLARAEGIRRFRASQLADPDVNVRLGTRYFAELVARFGVAHYALASYNAGESRVVRWRAERPGLDRDEFIDDIPFPETQNYVKRILGTSEDYRRLYEGGHATSAAAAPRARATTGTKAGATSGKKKAAARPPAKKKAHK